MPKLRPFGCASTHRQIRSAIMHQNAVKLASCDQYRARETTFAVNGSLISPLRASHCIKRHRKRRDLVIKQYETVKIRYVTLETRPRPAVSTECLRQSKKKGGFGLPSSQLGALIAFLASHRGVPVAHRAAGKGEERRTEPSRTGRVRSLDRVRVRYSPGPGAGPTRMGCRPACRHCSRCAIIRRVAVSARATINHRLGPASGTPRARLGHSSGSARVCLGYCATVSAL